MRFGTENAFTGVFFRLFCCWCMWKFMFLFWKFCCRNKFLRSPKQSSHFGNWFTLIHCVRIHFCPSRKDSKWIVGMEFLGAHDIISVYYLIVVTGFLKMNRFTNWFNWHVWCSAWCTNKSKIFITFDHSRWIVRIKMISRNSYK